MADIYEVKVDLQKLAANLAKTEGKPFTAAEVTRWLVEHDWTEIGPGLFCVEEISISMLAKDEILGMRLVA